MAREESKAKSLLRRSTMATLGAVLSALIKNKKKLALMQRYFEHFEFADYNTVASVLRWIRDNPCDLTDRPSSPRVLWNNNRMHEALKILGEVLASDAVRCVVETDKPVSQSEYDDIVAWLALCANGPLRGPQSMPGARSSGRTSCPMTTAMSSGRTSRPMTTAMSSQSRFRRRCHHVESSYITENREKHLKTPEGADM